MSHAPQIAIPATYMRGGTSKGVFFRLQDLPVAAQTPGAARDALLLRYPNIAPDRIELVGRGWEEPASPDSNLNRRVEVQWFTLE